MRSICANALLSCRRLTRPSNIAKRHQAFLLSSLSHATFFNESKQTNENNSEDTSSDEGTCLLGDRYKYHSWPTSEHAAFAFAQLATPGHTSINFKEFLSVLKRMQLDFNLGDAELERVFQSLDLNNDGRVSLEEFKIGRSNHPFTKSLVEALSGSGSLCDLGNIDENFPAKDFDWTVSTAEFYKAPLEYGFVGENVAIRKSLDYGYHNNYTHCRQLFQDMLIRKNVIIDGSGSARPWLVLTCGPMGVGKGWVLGWMSANGILPLERVSKIDPDAFKLRMPEWSIYQEQSVEVAGTKTHAESSYIAEIAKRIAMNNGMDVWIDGSLRQWKWYKKTLKSVRRRYPQYRIAIVGIDAPEDIIENNIKKRAAVTGRHIPKELRQASMQGIQRGIAELTRCVDLVARVQNKVPGEPTLQSVSMIDRSGNWDLVRELTSSTRSNNDSV